MRMARARGSDRRMRLKRSPRSDTRGGYTGELRGHIPGSNFPHYCVISHHVSRALSRKPSWHVRFSSPCSTVEREALMKRLVFGMLLVVLAANVSAQRQIGRGRETETQAPDPAAGQSLSGLTAAQRADFADGLGDFTEVEKVTDGLGPVFNERSCAACHSVPAIGGGSNRQVTRFATRTNGL